MRRNLPFLGENSPPPPTEAEGDTETEDTHAQNTSMHACKLVTLTLLPARPYPCAHRHRAAAQAVPGHLREAETFSYVLAVRSSSGARTSARG